MFLEKEDLKIFEIVLPSRRVANTPPDPPTCPDNQNLVSAPDNTGVQATFQVPTCNDNEQQITLIAQCTPNSGGIFTIGTTPVNCVCTDLGGLTSSCQFAISVAGLYHCDIGIYFNIHVANEILLKNRIEALKQ